jgi:hypothetical protein
MKLAEGAIGDVNALPEGTLPPPGLAHHPLRLVAIDANPEASSSFGGSATAGGAAAGSSGGGGAAGARGGAGRGLPGLRTPLALLMTNRLCKPEACG